MIRKMIIGVLLVLMVALTACGGGAADTTVDESEVAPPAFEGFANRALPEALQLQIGTLMLEKTPYAVTPAQAQELLPLWQMLRALQESGTASQIEVEAVFDQIQEAMTPEQLAAIEGMSQEDMWALFQELGMRRKADSEGGEGGGFRPPEGKMPPGGGEGKPGKGPGGFTDLSPEERAAIMAGRGGKGMGFGRAFTDQVIELLETRAAES